MDWTDIAKDAIDPKLSGAIRKSRRILAYTLFDPAVETTESYVKEISNRDGPFRVQKCAPHIVAAGCHNHSEIKADVDAQVLPHAGPDIQCLGIASTDAERLWVVRGLHASWLCGCLCCGAEAGSHKPQCRSC